MLIQQPRRVAWMHVRKIRMIYPNRRGLLVPLFARPPLRSRRRK